MNEYKSVVKFDKHLSIMIRNEFCIVTFHGVGINQAVPEDKQLFTLSLKSQRSHLSPNL